MEGLASAKGIVIKHIPTKGNAETVAAILGGHVMVAAGNPVAFRPHEDAGKLKCLAQFGHRRDMNFVCAHIQRTGYRCRGGPLALDRGP